MKIKITPNSTSSSWFSAYVGGRIWDKEWLHITTRLDELGVGDWRHSFVNRGSHVRFDFKREEDRTAFVLEFVE